jgi:hypothetical protein
MGTVRTEVVRMAAADAVGIIAGSRGDTLRRIALQTLPDDVSAHEGDLAVVLSLWVADLQSDEVSISEHREPFEIISLIAMAAGSFNPLGDALESVRTHEESLAAWQYEQRVAHRLGLLEEDKVQALEAIPGWVWE